MPSILSSMPAYKFYLQTKFTSRRPSWTSNSFRIYPWPVFICRTVPISPYICSYCCYSSLSLRAMWSSFDRFAVLYFCSNFLAIIVPFSDFQSTLLVCCSWSFFREINRTFFWVCSSHWCSPEVLAFFCQDLSA